MKLKKDFFEKLLIYTFPIIIVIDGSDSKIVIS